MPDSPTSEPESDFVCKYVPQLGGKPACAGEPFYGQRGGWQYCVLHFPGKEKRADFQHAFQRKLENKDFNFRGVWFPADLSFFKFAFDTEADFSYATFSAKANFSFATFGKVDFSHATFSAGPGFWHTTFSAAASFDSATFGTDADFSEPVEFSHAIFSAAAYFANAIFSREANFQGATFSKRASFDNATFTAADFSDATFTAGANFRDAIFSAEANFSHANLADHVSFAGSKTRQVFADTSSLDLQFARIEKPDRVSFHTLRLHPHWFVNVDPRKFDFTNVKWNNSGKAKPELELLIARTPELAADSPSASTGSGKTRRDQIKRLHRLLSQACQRLAANCEENARYRKASHFRRMALDAERLETWRGFDLRRLNWWYWAASGYGERPFQALLVLIGILVLFGLLYTRVGFVRWEPRLVSEADAAIAEKDQHGAPLRFPRAVSYSAGVMTLQKPEPKPATWAAQAAVLFETILGPVHAALLALAIRRKFMR